ncbi:MAG: hypothetical protein KJ726_03985 [Verrucomicrobia bacterium]|nr:hypothetical protein [Verrucomicrobiota bacterium]MBU1909186.1 hypothetical protein [Verrucomicrobiota bacterium]
MSPGLAEQPALPSRRPPAVPVERPRNWRPAAPLLFGLVFALAWHAAWLMGLGLARETPLSPPPPAPVLRFIQPPADAEKTASDPRLLWSPALFSLPSPWGFSRLVMDGRVGARPSVGVLDTAPLFLLEGPEMTERMAVGHDRRIEEDMAANLFRVPIPLLAGPVFHAPDRGPPPQVELMPEWTGSVFEAMPLPEGWEKAGDRAWEITAFIQVDDSDRVAHVFLEVPSAFPDLNRAIERALRSWKLAPGSLARSGRVVVRSAGEPAAPRSLEPSRP